MTEHYSSHIPEILLGLMGGFSYFKHCHNFIHEVKLATLVFLQLVLVKHTQEWEITFYDGKAHSMPLQYYPNSTHLLQMVHSVGNPDDVTAT